jgi:hypothetical protein
MGEPGCYLESGNRESAISSGHRGISNLQPSAISSLVPHSSLKCRVPPRPSRLHVKSARTSVPRGTTDRSSAGHLEYGPHSSLRSRLPPRPSRLHVNSALTSRSTWNNRSELGGLSGIWSALQPEKPCSFTPFTPTCELRPGTRFQMADGSRFQIPRLPDEITDSQIPRFQIRTASGSCS